MHRSGWDLSRTIQQQHQQGLNRELALITWSWTCQVANSLTCNSPKLAFSSAAPAYLPRTGPGT